MNASAHWISRITPLPGISYRQLAGLGNLDPYGQHQTLYRFFDLPPKEERTGQPVPFLFRAERQNGLPVFYMLSAQCPRDQQNLWQVDAKPYKPDLRVGDRLAFKLRVNPVVERHGGPVLNSNGAPKLRKSGNEKLKVVRHDVVMDAKQRIGWKEMSPDKRPNFALLAHNAGYRWLRDRAERKGFALDIDLRVDGYTSHCLRRQRDSNGQYRGLTLSTLDFEGVLTITDLASFRKSLMQGIGPAKSMGCGLLIIRRI